MNKWSEGRRLLKQWLTSCKLLRSLEQTEEMSQQIKCFSCNLPETLESLLHTDRCEDHWYYYSVKYTKPLSQLVSKQLDWQMSQVTINAAAAELMSSARKVKHTESAAAFPTGFCHVWALVPLGGVRKLNASDWESLWEHDLEARS